MLCPLMVMHVQLEMWVNKVYVSCFISGALRESKTFTIYFLYLSIWLRGEQKKIHNIVVCLCVVSLVKVVVPCGDDEDGATSITYTTFY